MYITRQLRLNTALIRIVLIVVLCASCFAACSKSKSSDNTNGVRDSYVYTCNSVEIYEPGYNLQVHNVVKYNDYYYAFVESYQNKTLAHSRYIYIYDDEWNLVEKREVSEAFEFLAGLLIDDGKIFYSDRSNRVQVYDLETETITQTAFCDDSIYGVYKSENGYVAVTMGAVYQFDSEWNLLHKIEDDSWEYFMGCNNYFEKDGKSYLVEGWPERYIELNFQNETSSVVLDPFNSGMHVDYICRDYIFDSDGLSKYDFANGQMEKLTSWNQMDLMPAKYKSADSKYFVIDDDMFVNIFNFQNGVVQLNVYTYDSSLDYSDRIELTVGGFDCRWDPALNLAIYNYNTSQDKYRIVIDEYIDRFDMSTYEASYKSKLEMIKYFEEGNAPDIFYGNNFDYESFFKSGYIINMYPYLLESVGEDGLSVLSDSIRNLMIKDETCYQVFASYMIESFVGDRTVVGDNTNLSIDDAPALTDGSDKFLYVNQLASDLARHTLGYSIPDGGYSADEIKNVIDYSLCYGIENFYKYSNITYNWIDESEAILHYSQVSCLWGWDSEEQYYGCELVSTGLPSLYGSKHLVHPYGRMAISSTSEYPDVCCDFISVIWSYDVQEFCASDYGIPVNDQCLKDSAYYLTDFDLIPEDDFYYLDTLIYDKEIPADAVERYLEAVYCANSIINYDWGLIDIIEEEIDTYYTLDKTVDEIASVIESRMTLYLSEQ